MACLLVHIFIEMVGESVFLLEANTQICREYLIGILENNYLAYKSV